MVDMDITEKIAKVIEAKENAKARKARLDKVIKIVSGRVGYAHKSYNVKLIGKEWPPEQDLYWYCDYPTGAPFGGRIQSTSGNEKVVVVHTD